MNINELTRKREKNIIEQTSIKLFIATTDCANERY